VRLGQRMCGGTVGHVGLHGRMPWIVVDGEARCGVVDDHDRCEWVNVSSGISLPGLSQTKSRKPQNSCSIVVVVNQLLNLQSSVIDVTGNQSELTRISVLFCM